MLWLHLFSARFFFFFTDPATTEIYTLSLHDALPIFAPGPGAGTIRGIGGLGPRSRRRRGRGAACAVQPSGAADPRSEEHTSELQSRPHLVCRLLLEKKK